MTLTEYILHEKQLLDKFALDHRLMQNLPSVEDWHVKFYEWSIRQEQLNNEHKTS